jgi:hypothetical protein
VGVDVSVTVERLRAFLLSSVRTLPMHASADDRAAKLRHVLRENRFTEALALLVVAQQSLYLWQRLRLIHVQAREEEHLQDVIAEARRVLAGNEEADGELIAELFQVLSAYGALRPLEVHRFRSKRKLEEDVALLRSSFESFAAARNAQVSSWPDIQQPTIMDALGVLNDGARTARRRARTLGAGAADRASGWLEKVADRLQQEGQPDDEKKSELDPADDELTDRRRQQQHRLDADADPDQDSPAVEPPTG